tara:strand:- start:10300 stop:10932 length:633 start_codon:yes stop_codon:yes gene_type:complete
MDLYENHPNFNENGALTIITGPMFSGKTTALINFYNKINNWSVPIHNNQKSNVKKRAIVLNHNLDVRYSTTGLVNHNQSKVPCLFIENLKQFSDLENKETTQQFIDADFILINECQFFTDIKEWVFIAVNNYSKNIYISGLDGDFQQKIFGNWYELIPYCDHIIKLHSTCHLCKNDNAIFSHRITNEEKQNVIGSNNYIPLCRNCFINSF